mmetsp:Transcript_12613/g.18091  ORF Transcript_12613/g.18091 Transcript_12613/m.18091 type:complete len:277 (+) Transcript_12613:1288-2118(+)
MTPLEVLQEVVDHAVVKVLSSQVGISSSGLDLKDSLLNGQKRHIKSSSTKIENQDILLLALLIKTVGNGSSGGLVNDTQHIESSDGTGVLGGLTLRVVKVGRNGDNGVLDLLAQICLGNLTHLGEDHGTDLLSLELLGLTLVLNLDNRCSAGAGGDLERPVLHVSLNSGVRKLAANETLGIEDGVGSVHGSLGFGGISNKTLGLGECYIGRGCPVSLIVGDDFHTVVLPDAYTRVGGTEINTDGFSSYLSHFLIVSCMIGCFCVRSNVANDFTTNY